MIIPIIIIRWWGKVEKGWWQKACRKSYKNGWTKIERKEERQWAGKVIIGRGEQK